MSYTYEPCVCGHCGAEFTKWGDLVKHLFKEHENP
jgi:hypothetical protein